MTGGAFQTSDSVWSSPTDFRRRFLALLSYQFSTFSPPLALNILQNRNVGKPAQPGGLVGRQRAGSGWLGGSRRRMWWSRKREGPGVEGLVLAYILLASAQQALPALGTPARTVVST